MAGGSLPQASGQRTAVGKRVCGVGWGGSDGIIVTIYTALYLLLTLIILNTYMY